MTSDETQSEGRLMLVGQEVTSALSKAYLEIGYCPQHDALWKELTTREHLRLYAGIRGVPKHAIENLCSRIMNQLRINEHADKQVKDLSGGTKRKLCFGISLLGQPKLLLLDEPSTGMDPQAKRFLWEIILNLFERNKDRGVVLTTHSMEEADALCNRLGILVKGVLRCLGTIQHLKDKYGAGYLLELKWDLEAGPIDQVKGLVAQMFGSQATVREEFQDRISFDVPQNAVKSLSQVFAALDQMKQSQNGLQDYSFGQTTFEQVFIAFAKQQEE
jgi:ATP-binding cassette subfamily A (ABC1) protein 5